MNKLIGRSKGKHDFQWTGIPATISICVCLIILSNDSYAQNTVNSNKVMGVKVGDQVWSDRNLDVVVFRNGDSIPEARTNEEWERAGREGRPAWSYYENDLGKGKIYGRMYNWYAVNDPRGLAPEGWHVPTNEEWIRLEEFVGIAEAGFRLKCGNGWMKNGNGDNSTKFCVLPGGYRARTGNFHGAGEFTYLSSLTESKPGEEGSDKIFIWGRGVQFENRDIMRCGLDKEFGLYVRCVKD